MIRLHLLCYVSQLLLSAYKFKGKFDKVVSIIKYIVNYIFKILTFGYYIRVLLEINGLMIISSLNEIYQFNTSDRLRSFSLVIAIFTFIFWISFLVFIIIVMIRSTEAADNEESKLGEFFSGLKLQRRYKFYTVFLMSRRFIFILLLIWIVPSSPDAVLYKNKFKLNLYMDYKRKWT